MLPHQLAGVAVRRIGRQIKEPQLSLQAFDKNSCFLRDVGRSTIGGQEDLVLGADNQSLQKLDKQRGGDAALFVLIKEMTADKVVEQIKDYGGVVLKTSLDDAKEQALRNALAGVAGSGAA